MSRFAKTILMLVATLMAGWASTTNAAAAQPGDSVPAGPIAAVRPLTLAQAAAELASQRRLSAAPADCVTNVGIYSIQARKYAATEMNEGRLLRARTPAGQVGPWELYEFCENFDTGVLTIRSMHANLYLSTEMNERGLLRARTPANALGPWERFRMDRIPGSSEYFLYSFSANAYVATEMNEGALLRARTPANALGSWERFV